jgi:hypothetical protein
MTTQFNILQNLMSVKVKVPLWVFAGFALMLYAAWEIYWVSQVGYSAIKWHTHLMLYVYAWFCSLLLLLPLKRHRLINEIVLVVSITLFTLGSIELVLTLTGYNKTYIENRSGKYVSLFNETSTDSLRICHAPKTTHQLRSPEFNYPRQTNQYGFSDFIFRHDTGRVLVQTYGDSFTEGDGSPFDSSYPAILRQLLGEKYSVQNYGICGNDPAFYLPQYNHVGRLFHPNVMVFCYGSGDFMHDWATRGGLERFTPTGWQSQKGPWWEPIYALSYVARLFIEASGRHCNDFFMSPQEKEENLRALAPKWNELFVALANTAARDSTKILLLKKPERSEVALNKYQYDFAFFDSLVTTLPGVKHYDLLPFYRDTFGLKSQEATAPYYWPQDGHHNPAGYALMAKGVYQALQRNNQLQSYFIK